VKRWWMVQSCMMEVGILYLISFTKRQIQRNGHFKLYVQGKDQYIIETKIIKLNESLKNTLSIEFESSLLALAPLIFPLHQLGLGWVTETCVLVLASMAQNTLDWHWGLLRRCSPLLRAGDPTQPSGGAGTNHLVGGRPQDSVAGSPRGLPLSNDA
jgi:hypothetical protein